MFCLHPTDDYLLTFIIYPQKMNVYPVKKSFHKKQKLALPNF